MRARAGVPQQHASVGKPRSALAMPNHVARSVVSHRPSLIVPPPKVVRRARTGVDAAHTNDPGRISTTVRGKLSLGNVSSPSTQVPRPCSCPPSLRRASAFPNRGLPATRPFQYVRAPQPCDERVPPDVGRTIGSLRATRGAAP